MNTPDPNKPAPGTAGAYKAAYERQFALAPKELQDKLVRAQREDFVDKEADAFIQSVATEAEN